MSRSGAGGIRTLVQTVKQYAFYMLILAFIFVLRQDPSHQLPAYLLHFRASIAACLRYPEYFCAAIPVEPSGVGSERRLGSAPCAEAKLIYYTSIKRRELHCSCQLLFYRPDLRASLQCSACLHTCSTCCQNQLSPSRSANGAYQISLGEIGRTIASALRKRTCQGSFSRLLLTSPEKSTIVGFSESGDNRALYVAERHL